MLAATTDTAGLATPDAATYNTFTDKHFDFSNDLNWLLAVSFLPMILFQKRHHEVDHQLLLLRLGFGDHHRQRHKRVVGDAFRAILSQ